MHLNIDCHTHTHILLNYQARVLCVCEYDYEYFRSTFNTVKPHSLGEGFEPTHQLMTLGASSKPLHILKKVDNISSPVSSIKIHTDATGPEKKLITRVPNNPSCDLEQD